MIIDNDDVRLKVIDKDGDSLMVHEREPSGVVVITCRSADRDEYAAVILTNEERIELIKRLGGKAWEKR